MTGVEQCIGDCVRLESFEKDFGESSLLVKGSNRGHSLNRLR